ncbi:hypothetical protein B0H66DRAFT_631169 [Apodospora peruviana]|uniref:Condensation domain-containing protein n=1 Tax=Apodospora peruviana TaxID=516989 RepID=A0AAE0HWX0_9PEZI|nr:hypothetical protein B0H66DRAFT_631169 [Apodospora peruviana]
MLNSQIKMPGLWQSDTAHKITTPPGCHVDVARLQSAWRQVTARHEALRTVFIPTVLRDGEHLQLVLRRHIPQVPLIQLDDGADIERVIGITAPSTTHCTNRPSRSPSSSKEEEQRYTVNWRSATRCKTALACASSTGTSSEPNKAICPREPPHLVSTSTCTSGLLTATVEFWTSYLFDLIDKPCYIPRVVAAVGGASLSRDKRNDHGFLDINLGDGSTPTMAAAIAKVVRAHRVTPATLFEAAWVVCLAELTSSDEVLFGYVTANQDLYMPLSSSTASSGGVDLEDLLRPMINMLVCRMRIKNNKKQEVGHEEDITTTSTGADLVRQTHASFLKVIEFQHGFAEAAVRLERESGAPLPFNSVLNVDYIRDGSGSNDAGGGGAYYPVGSDGRSSSRGGGGSSDDFLDFETMFGSRSPEFDVILGVLLGEASVDVQLGCWLES